MVDELRAMDIELMVTFWPGVGGSKVSRRCAFVLVAVLSVVLVATPLLSATRMVCWHALMARARLRSTSPSSTLPGTSRSTRPRGGAARSGARSPRRQAMQSWTPRTRRRSPPPTGCGSRATASTVVGLQPGFLPLARSRPLTHSHSPAALALSGTRSIWLDESEPDHAKDITGGQWQLAMGVDAEVLPAWVYDWTKGFQSEMRARECGRRVLRALPKRLGRHGGARRGAMVG